MFCDRSFSGCSTTRAAAHILGRPVLGQRKAGIQACNAIYKKDDDRRAQKKNAQKAIAAVMLGKEKSLSLHKRKQAVLEELVTPPTKKSVNSSLTATKKSGSKELDEKIASFFYENGIAFTVANSSSFALMIEESIKFAKQNPLQSYKTPHRKLLAGDLLDRAYTSTEKIVAPVIAGAAKYGATMASDGWSDARRRPILNLLRHNWTGTVHTRRRQVSFKMKQCGPTLHRCHQRHGMRCM